jgi:hypothetical protein
MRALVIDEEAKAKAARVVAYARAHPYDPNRGTDSAVAIPGENPQHVVELNSFRCVFTHTYSHDPAAWFRHLTISVPSKDYPNPFAAYTIAELFEFTGWDGHSAEPPTGWSIAVNKDEHCIVLAQKLAEVP